MISPLKNLMQLLHLEKQHKDKEYDHLVSHPRCAEAREFVEMLWEYFEPYSDNNFREEIVANFHSRFWEMYLAYVLMKHNLATRHL